MGSPVCSGRQALRRFGGSFNAEAQAFSTKSISFWSHTASSCWTLPLQNSNQQRSGQSQGPTGGAGASQFFQERGRLRREVLRSQDSLP